MPVALRIAEIAAERRTLVSWLGVEYSLAPEAKFPMQVEQALAEYKNVLDQSIDA